MNVVAPQDWRDELLALKGDGFAFLDFLTVVDRLDSLEVVVHLVKPDTAEQLLISTTVPAEAARLDSVAGVFASANWHEREASEMFGLEFTGHPDPRPLLLRTALGAPPLRKSVVLAARVAVDWPGAAEPDVREDGRRAGNPSRRRQRPPGAPDDWLEPAP